MIGGSPASFRAYSPSILSAEMKPRRAAWIWAFQGRRQPARFGYIKPTQLPSVCRDRCAQDRQKPPHLPRVLG